LTAAFLDAVDLALDMDGFGHGGFAF